MVVNFEYNNTTKKMFKMIFISPLLFYNSETKSVYIKELFKDYTEINSPYKS
jgi:hypothetical protein